LVSFRSMT